MTSKKIIIVFKSVPNCLLLANYLKSWSFYFWDLRVDLLNWKPDLTQFVYNISDNMLEIVLMLSQKFVKSF